ncbi:hypothetical protein EKA14_27535 [Bacillus mycoides]|nr:hypothetical protein EKA14_27535 [Bacillus mycoides]
MLFFKLCNRTVYLIVCFRTFYTIHALYKQKRSLQRGFAFSTYNELQQLLATSEFFFLMYLLSCIF